MSKAIIEMEEDQEVMGLIHDEGSAHYHRLRQELKVKDENTFNNCMRVPPHMFDKLLQRVRPIFHKKHTQM